MKNYLVHIFTLLIFTGLSANDTTTFVGKLPNSLYSEKQIIRFKNGLLVVNSVGQYRNNKYHGGLKKTQVSLFNANNSEKSFGYVKEIVLLPSDAEWQYFSGRTNKKSTTPLYSVHQKNLSGIVLGSNHAIIDFNSSHFVTNSHGNLFDYKLQKNNYWFKELYLTKDFLGFRFQNHLNPDYYTVRNNLVKSCFIRIGKDGRPSKIMKKDKLFSLSESQGYPELLNDNSLVVKSSSRRIKEYIGGKFLHKYIITLSFYDKESQKKLGDFEFKPEYNYNPSENTPSVQVHLSEDLKHCIVLFKDPYKWDLTKEAHLYKLPSISVE